MNPYFINGERLLRQGRAKEAVDAFRQSLAQDPQDARCQGMLALALQGARDGDEALRAAREAVRLDSEDPFTHYVLGLMYLVHHQLDEAMRCANESIRIQPDVAEYYRLLAMVLSEQKKYKEALGVVEQGLVHDPEDSDCLNLRGQLLIQLNRKAEARAVVAQSLASTPDSADSHANAGWTALHHNRTKDALLHFKEALRLEPGHEWAKAGLAEALKARNPLYRLLLGFMLWMVRLDSRVRIGVIVGGYVLYRIADNYAQKNPDLAPYVWPLLVAYIVFAWMTWVGMPLADLILRLSPYGKHALSPRQNFVSGVLGLFIVLAVGCYGVYLYAGAEGWSDATIQIGMLALIVIGVLQLHRAPRYKLLLAGCGVLALLAMLNHVARLVVDQGLYDLSLNGFIYGFIGMMWFIALGGAGTPRTQYR